MALLVLLLFIQVTARYVFAESPEWTEELARLVFVYLTFLGGALAVARRANLRVDTFVLLLPRNVQWILMWAGTVGAIVFLAVAVFTGVAMVDRLAQQTMTSLPISKAYGFIGVPLGCAVMLAYEAARLYELRTPPPPPGRRAEIETLAHTAD